MKCWKCHRKEFLFKCRRCEKYFCSRHRLPEDHDCEQAPKGNIFKNIRNNKNFRESHRHNWRGSDYHKKENVLEKVYYYTNKSLKFIPIIGLILLFIIYPYIEKMKVSQTHLILGSFNFSNIPEMIFTAVAIITVITAYKYWLLRMRLIRHNRFLAKTIIFAIILLLFSRHIPLNSAIGQYYDWLFFIISSIAIISLTILTAKKINSINLASDLACWGLRLLGGVFAFAGFIAFFFASVALVASAISNVAWVSQGIFWVLGACLFLLGAFCEFRSLRRYPMLGIWHA